MTFVIIIAVIVLEGFPPEFALNFILARQSVRKHSG